MKKRTIYSLLTGYSKENVDKAIETLTEDEKALIKLRYGDDLSNPDKNLILDEEQHHKFYRLLIPKLKGILKKMTKKLKTIYEYFPGYSKEDVDNAIKKIHPNAKKLLYLRYGENLDKTSKSPEWTNDMTLRFHNQTLKAIQNQLLQSAYSITIYDYFEGVSEEKVNALLMELPFEEKYLLYLKYGKNLHCPKKNSEWNEKLGRKFQNLKSKLQRRMARAYDLIEALSFEEDKDWQRIIFICEGATVEKESKPVDSNEIESMNYLNNSFYNTELFQGVMVSLKEQDVKIVIMKYKENLAILEIAKLLGISELEVIQALRRALLVYEMAILREVETPVLDTDMKRVLELPNTNEEE